MLTTFPQCNFSLEFPEILSQNHIWYHWLSVCGISQIMHCGILINISYWTVACEYGLLVVPCCFKTTDLKLFYWLVEAFNFFASCSYKSAHNQLNIRPILFFLIHDAAYINGSTVSVIMLLVGGSMVTEVNNVKVMEGSWCRLNLDLSPDSHRLNGKMTT